jgi:hypothetical protein
MEKCYVRTVRFEFLNIIHTAFRGLNQFQVVILVCNQIILRQTAETA